VFEIKAAIFEQLKWHQAKENRQIKPGLNLS